MHFWWLLLWFYDLKICSSTNFVCLNEIKLLIFNHFSLQKCQPHIVQTQTSAINMTSGNVVFKGSFRNFKYPEYSVCFGHPNQTCHYSFTIYLFPESPREPYHGKWGPKIGCFLTETHGTKSTAEKNNHVSHSRDWRRPTSEPPIRWEASRGLQILSFILSEWIPAWKSEGTILLLPAMTNHPSIQ